MRHFVNVALVFFFVTLVGTGLMRFFFPFSLVTTRVHIVFGFGVLVLVGLHLVSRTKYFLRVAQTALGEEEERRRLVSQRSVMAVVGLWMFLLGTALWDYPRSHNSSTLATNPGIEPPSCARTTERSINL